MYSIAFKPTLRRKRGSSNPAEPTMSVSSKKTQKHTKTQIFNTFGIPKLCFHPKPSSLSSYHQKSKAEMLVQGLLNLAFHPSFFCGGVLPAEISLKSGSCPSLKA